MVSVIPFHVIVEIMKENKFLTVNTVRVRIRGFWSRLNLVGFFLNKCSELLL